MKQRTYSHRQHNAKLCIAAQNARIGFGSLFQRKGFDHGAYSAQFGKAKRVIGFRRRGGVIGILVAILPSLRRAPTSAAAPATSSISAASQAAVPKTGTTPQTVPSDSVKSDPLPTPERSSKQNQKWGITIYFDANPSTEQEEGYISDSSDIVLSIDGTVFTKKLDQFHEHAAIEIPL